MSLTAKDLEAVRRDHQPAALLPFLVALAVLRVPWLVWRLARRREVGPPAEPTGGE